MDADDARKKSNQLAAAMLEGASVLPMLAGWAYVLRHRRQMLRALMSFELAFTEMVRSQEEGKLSAGSTDFSREDLARVKRLCDLIRPGLHTKDVKKSAAEIEDLADRLYHALTGQEVLRRRASR